MFSHRYMEAKSREVQKRLNWIEQKYNQAAQTARYLLRRNIVKRRARYLAIFTQCQSYSQKELLNLIMSPNVYNTAE